MHIKANSTIFGEKEINQEKKNPMGVPSSSYPNPNSNIQVQIYGTS